jgi:ribose 5-phosphate isomerase B
MKIIIGSDHRGFALKNYLKDWLASNGHEVEDLGTDNLTASDYPDYAISVARAISKDEASLGILICGTGIGMSIAANKVKGIRAARVCSAKDAEMSKKHNDSNVLCIGADLVDELMAQRMISAWLETTFEGDRHQRRLSKISDFEKKSHDVG